MLPEKPLVSDGLQVSFTAGKLASGERYDVSISIPYTGDGEKGCRYTQSVRVRGARKPGRRVSVSLVPKAFSSFGTGRFCEGRATLRLSRVDVDDRAVVLAKRAFNLTPDNPGVQEPVSTPVRMDILDGSALVVQAPGRPDRTLPVGGVLHGAIPGKFRPSTDIQVTNLTGPIWLRSVTPDPLCAGATYASELGLSAPATISLKASGESEMPLTLGVSPSRSPAARARPRERRR